MTSGENEADPGTGSAQCTPGTQSKHACLGTQGKMIYTPDARGNTIPDFSRAGYMGGGIELPAVPGKAFVDPGPGDDLARIQAAIAKVAALPPNAQGLRGAVVLGQGQYEVSGTIKINTSGIVLRGKGNNDNGSVIIATGTKPRALIEVSGSGSRSEVSSSRVKVTDSYVPFGSKSLHVDSTAGFDVGDQVVVHRPSTAAWIHDLGMDKIPPRSDGGQVVQWEAGKYDLDFERVITAIDGKRITLDAPVMNALDSKYGGGSVYAYEFAGRISQVGIESLKLVSEYQAGKESSDEAHATDGVRLDKVENAWVQNVTAMHFVYAAVNVGGNAKHVTVSDCACLDPVSKITGGRRYSFNVDGSYTLVQRCKARNGRHDFVTGARVAGPNVFLDSKAESCHADSGPHHRWATGTLYDNVEASELKVQDRGNYGSGHGWAGAQQVFWNCTGEAVCQNPPTAANFAIGHVGPHAEGRYDRPECHWDVEGKHVLVRSLYLQQLEDRLSNAP